MRQRRHAAYVCHIRLGTTLREISVNLYVLFFKASTIVCAYFSQCTKKSQLCYCHRLHNYVCMYVCMYTPPLCRETELILGKPTRRNLCATICAIEYHKMTEKKMLIKCKHTHTYTGGTLVYLCDPCKHLFYLNNPKKIKRANRKKFARLLRAGVAVAVAVAATAGVAVQPNPHAASDKTTTKN